MTATEIANGLTHGTLDIWITIPEGNRAREIAQLLEKKELPTLTPTPKSAKSVPASTIYDLGSNLHWFPSSRHLILTLNGKIDVMEYDRTNWVTIYSGPFVDDFVAPWTNGSRIIILTNLNGDATSLPNLYTVNLR